MKSCEEMVHSLLERRDRYTASRKKRIMATRIASSVLCLCIAASVTVGFIIGRAESADRDSNEAVTSSIETAEDIEYLPVLDLSGMIIYNGRTYVQNSRLSFEDIILGEKLGDGDDFEGTYNTEWLKDKYEEYGGKAVCFSWENNPKAEIYTVKGNDRLLCVILDNGGRVILEEE